jgi:hypothetical protein
MDACERFNRVLWGTPGHCSCPCNRRWSTAAEEGTGTTGVSPYTMLCAREQRSAERPALWEKKLRRRIRLLCCLLGPDTPPADTAALRTRGKLHTVGPVKIFNHFHQVFGVSRSIKRGRAYPRNVSSGPRVPERC